ncbi:isochorismatase family protein [Actinoallomurus sp. NBC_01490]|jgi:nicotinamidase-related amidase|uniref:isochorismatase family protein n=1 Tax=Actinoallomurus sp. NBC_01490 TaxID=2903557 RepID=UPI002E33C506|nr:isochorismatase family protein [Actinoallomurus sp. NBC_01490]
MVSAPAPTARPGAQDSLPPPSSLWNDLLGEDERARLAHGRFARRSGFGKRPAVVVIDAQNYMLGPIGDEPYEYVSSCGEVGRAGARQIARLLDAAREAGAPVFYTRFELARDGSDMGAYRRKRDLVESEGWCLEDSFGAAIADVVAPKDGDIVMVKKKPSGFVGTPLLGLLIDRGVDTVIVVGGSTSNCVRATAVDAVSLNFRVVVPADCVFDRVGISHRVALFDLDRQYGDVMWCDEVIAALREGPTA